MSSKSSSECFVERSLILEGEVGLVSSVLESGSREGGDEDSEFEVAGGCAPAAVLPVCRDGSWSRRGVISDVDPLSFSLATKKF